MERFSDKDKDSDSEDETSKKQDSPKESTSQVTQEDASSEEEATQNHANFKINTADVNFNGKMKNLTRKYAARVVRSRGPLGLYSRSFTFGQDSEDNRISVPWKLLWNMGIGPRIHLGTTFRRSWPSYSRNRFGLDEMSPVDSEGNDFPYQVAEHSPGESSSDDEMMFFREALFSSTVENSSPEPLICLPKSCGDVFCDCSSLDVDYCFSDDDTSTDDDDDYQGSSYVRYMRMNSAWNANPAAQSQSYIFRPEALGLPSPFSSTASETLDISSPDSDSEAEYDQPRLIPESYAAPRRQRTRPRRGCLSSSTGSSNAENDTDSEQEIIVDSPDTPPGRPLPVSGLSRLAARQMIRRRLFVSDEHVESMDADDATQPANFPNHSNHYENSAAEGGDRSL